MKKLLLLTKTLLVMTLLCVGASNAWADVEWQLAWADYFEDASKYTTNISWGSTGSLTISQADRPDGVTGKYYYVFDNGGNGRVWTFTIGNAYEASGTSWNKYTFSAGEAYKLEFDIAFRSDRFNNSSGQNQSFTIPGLVSMVLPKAATTATFTAVSDYAAGSISAGDELFTIAAAYDYTSTDNVFGNHFYHFVVEGRSTGTTLTVYGPYSTGSYSSTPVYNAKLSDSKIDVTTITGDVRRYYTSMGLDNVVLYKEVEAGSVEVPTAAITAVDGVNRTVTFACVTDGVTLSYSTDGGSSFTEGTSLVISENTDIIVKATKGLNSAQSATLSFEAGTEVTLNTPTWTKTGYSAGVSTVTLADNQSDKLLNPASTIKYQINDGEEQTYSAAINVNDGETLKYWSVAAGYTDSPKGSVVANAPSTDPIILNETYNGSDLGITVNTEEVVTTIGGGATPYYYMYANAAHVSENLLTSNTGASNWMVRSTGIYAGNTINYALRNVQKNDVVTIKVVWGAEHPVPTATDGTLDNWNSVSGDTYVFKVTSTMGNFRFSLARYASVKSITVQRASVSVTVTNAGYATYVPSCDLDFSETSIKAYKVKVNTKGVATMTKVDNVPAGTPVLLYKDGGATEDIPVMTGAAAVSDNDLVAGTGAAVQTTEGDYTNMILNNVSGIGFYFANGQTVAANRAYLHIATSLAPDAVGGARMAMLFAGSVTGVDNVEAAAEAKAKDGKYIEGNQLYIYKKGVKFNAAGQQVK